MLWCYHSNERLRQNVCEVLHVFHSWDFTKRIWTFCLSYWPLIRVKELTLFLLISLDCKLVPFDLEWYESVARYYLLTSLLLEQNTYILHRKSTKSRHNCKHNFALRRKKNANVHSGVYHFAKNYPSGVGWVGFGDFPDIPTNTEGAAVPRLSSSFLLILQIVLSSVATEFNVNE